MLRRFLAVVVASVAVLGTSAGAALAQYPPTTGSGAVSATTVVIGNTVNFSGGGFAAGSHVTVTVNGALYATVTASGPASSALSGPSKAHFATAAFARPAAAAAANSASFSLTISMNKLGLATLVAAGTDPLGAPRTVKALVTVVPAAVAPATEASSGSSLPFTGSNVLVPGAIIGFAMLAGGFLLLTSVRSRRAGAGG